MTPHASLLSLRARGLVRRSERRRLICRNSMGVHLDPPEYDASKSKIRLDPPKHAYGLSVGQMAALGLTGDQVQKRFQVEAVNTTSLA